jgi:hypothetical protein
VDLLGRPRRGTATQTPLASSRELDSLKGREPIPERPPERVYGDNSDVLGTPPIARKETCCISFGGALPEDLSEIAHVQFELDSVFLEPEFRGWKARLPNLLSGRTARPTILLALQRFSGLVQLRDSG